MPRCSSLAGRACTSRALHHAGYARRNVGGRGVRVPGLRRTARCATGGRQAEPRTFRVLKVASVYAAYTDLKYLLPSAALT